jgi:formate-dependent nitrite reductase cytochrome c552 subunit
LTGSWGETDLVEFRWSWYHAVNGFALTPGQPVDGIGGYFDRLGVMFDHPKARACFNCHASRVPLHDGRIDETALRPGVTCQRCHGPRAEHVATGGEVVDPSWRGADRMESVNRCAQCHRRADEQESARIRPENVDIVRFQPVGLVQSACFKGSEMTCVTCHDPHRPLEAQDSLGIWQCAQCHDASHGGQSVCRAGHVDECLDCHMPKVRLDAPVLFTDHWIRIRQVEPPQP